MDLDRIETVTVDSYSTLVDVDAQQAVLEEHVEGLDDGASVSRQWRSQYLYYSMIANEIGAYRPFWELIGLGLRYALESHGYDVSADVRDEVRRIVYEDRLTVFDDVTDGVTRLAEAGYDVFVVSNGTPAMREHLVAAADIDDVVVDAISADEVETYKPHPAIYRHAAARTGTPIDRILHVSGGGMRDVWGAKHAGMHTAWLARPEKALPHEELGPEPDLIVTDFDDLTARLL